MPLPPIIFLAAIMCSTAVLLTAMVLISGHIARRRLAAKTVPDDEILRRLERIEQMVEGTAVEVERLGESSRFVTKLLADRTDAPRAERS